MMSGTSAFWSLAAAGVCAAIPATAQTEAERSAEADFERCVDSVTTYADVDYASCYAARYEEADTRLNSRWRHLLSLIDSERFAEDATAMRDTLVSAQRDWIAFKESACDFYLLGYQGTMARHHHLPRCRIDIVEHRIAEIEAMITNIDPAYYEGREAF